MRAVAKLSESLAVRSEASRTTIGFTVDRTLGQNLQQLVEELFSALLGGLGMHASTPGAAPPAERIDTTPAVFQPSINASQLPVYDPHAMFAEEVEAQEGPFGIRIDSIRLPSDPKVGLEIKVVGFSGAI